MKRNDFIEIKNLDIKALGAKVRTLRTEIADSVMDKHMNTLKNAKSIRNKRKEIAQLLTVIRQKELLSVLESASKGGEK